MGKFSHDNYATEHLGVSVLDTRHLARGADLTRLCQTWRAASGGTVVAQSARRLFVALIAVHGSPQAMQKAVQKIMQKTYNDCCTVLDRFE
jgi:hypothetical protein